MNVMEAHVLEEDDPNGTPVDVITQDDVVDMGFEVHRRGAGKGFVTMRRDHPKAALLLPDRYIKWVVPVVDDEPLFGSWLRSGLAHLVSAKGTGAEILKMGGPGARDILRFALLMWNIYAPGQTARGDEPNVPMNYRWRFEPYGAIAVRGLEEGLHQPGSPLADMTWDFTRDVDSGDIAWAEIAAEWQTSIGTDVGQLMDLMERHGDFIFEVEPHLLAHAWQTFPSRDLTSSIILQRGAASNISSELGRQIDAMANYTHAHLENLDGDFHTEVLPGFTGRAHYGYVRAHQTNDSTTVNKIGQEAIRASRTRVEALAVDVDPRQILPGKAGTAGDVWVGDYVSLSTGTDFLDYDEAPQLVTGFRLGLAKGAKAGDATTVRRSLTFTALLNAEDRVSAGGSGPGPTEAHLHGNMLCWDGPEDPET